MPQHLLSKQGHPKNPGTAVSNNVKSSIRSCEVARCCNSGLGIFSAAGIVAALHAVPVRQRGAAPMLSAYLAGEMSG